jgi:formylmethanofuran dehydrogenase subunit E
MNHPDFFDAVPKISLYDPLAEFLGATDDGVMRYGYLDAVKLAGHSCPTVACAYWSTYRALAFLYPDTLPVRGDIRVEFGQDETSGVTGVIANVVSMLTGAMSGNGFKGIGGRFDRRNKLFFSVAGMQAEIRYTRLDTQQSVKVTSTPQRVASPPRLSELMSVCLSDSATPDERKAFRQLWQDRVRCILLEHGDDPAVFALTPA